MLVNTGPVLTTELENYILDRVGLSHSMGLSVTQFFLKDGQHPDLCDKSRIILRFFCPSHGQEHVLYYLYLCVCDIKKCASKKKSARNF